MSDMVLIHHGIKGMKWGVRRYQNTDGSLTAAGKKRYGVSGDKRRDALALNALASQRLADYNRGHAEKAESRVRSSKHAIVRGLNRIETAHSRSEQKTWERNAAKYDRKLDRHDKRVSKQRKKLQGNAAASRMFAEASQERVDKALKSAGSVKIGTLAPGFDMLKKGAYYLEAAQAIDSKQMWEREARKDQRKLDRFNKRHGS